MLVVFYHSEIHHSGLFFGINNLFSQSKTNLEILFNTSFKMYFFFCHEFFLQIFKILLKV